MPRRAAVSSYTQHSERPLYLVIMHKLYKTSRVLSRWIRAFRGRVNQRRVTPHGDNVGICLDRSTHKLIRAAIASNRAPQQTVLHLVWHSSVGCTHACTNATGSPARHVFLGYRLNSTRFLAISTVGAILADCPRLDELALGAVVIFDRGGLLRAFVGGVAGHVVIGQHCHLDDQQPCAFYLLDTQSMWNADGRWGLALQESEDDLRDVTSPTV